MLFYLSKTFHERLTHKIMAQILFEADIKCIIDAGGWLGDTATTLAESSPNTLVYTIEPSLQNCNFIKKYIKKKNIKNIKVIQKCLSADGISKFNTNTSSIFADKQYKISSDGIDSITIDSIYKNNKNLGLIHLDVEGYEFECLKGAYDSIKCGNIIFIVEILEMNKHKQNIIDLFKKNNYCIYIIPEKVSWAGKKGNNFIFFPKNYNKLTIKNFAKRYKLLDFVIF